MIEITSRATRYVASLLSFGLRLYSTNQIQDKIGAYDDTQLATTSKGRDIGGNAVNNTMNLFSGILYFVICEPLYRFRTNTDRLTLGLTVVRIRTCTSTNYLYANLPLFRFGLSFFPGFLFSE